MKVDGTGYFALDSNALPWEQRTNPHLPAPIFRKVLHTDAETGVFFQLVRYPRGVINPSHTHPCSHAIYVLEGTLATHRGSYGPGAFVWFPEGEVMEHGAGTDGDVVVLLVSNKPFEIQYVGSSPQRTDR
jgi:quercetin dioxygenase-like cupin family protein